jgi:putative peptide zinc metalloprotease protein
MTMKNPGIQLQTAQVPSQEVAAPPPEPAPEEALPVFRRDLELYRAPDEPDGSPAYSLFDPITAMFFRITWGEATLMKTLRPGITMSKLVAEIDKKTTIKVTAEEVSFFFEQAKRSKLLSVPLPASEIMQEAEKAKVSPLKWLLFHYLYFRIPLFNPDHILEAALPYARKLIAPLALAIYSIVTVIGFVLLVGRLDEFLHTFPYFFNMKGVIFYSTAIVLTKIFHELGHGFVAKHFGVRVPMMGIAMIFFWPVMYTDITDSWKMDDRKQRLWITAAGVIVELTIAGMCTLGWALTGPGVLNSVFFIVSSITWISTLLVNVNPAMRFDGYYLFSDLLGVDNLQMRAFAYTQWQFRKFLYGLDIPPPEEVNDSKRHYGMMFYSVYTWIYRLFLYTAIAIMVYTQFAKALGIFLFFLEIGVFLLWPLHGELTKLFEMRQHFTINPRLIVTLIIIGSLLAWAIIPLPHTQYFSAVTAPLEEQVIYIPRDGQIQDLYIKRGVEVVVGQPLLRIESKELANSIRSAEVDMDILLTELDILGSSEEENRAFIPEKMAELASIEEVFQGLMEQRKQNLIYANTKGIVYHWDEGTRPGQYVSKDQVLGKVADVSRMKVVCYVPERYVDGVKIGQKAIFQLKEDPAILEGLVSSVSPVRSEVLKYPQLSSMYHGELPVIPGEGEELRMVETFYEVTIAVDIRDVAEQGSEIRLGETGKVALRGKWRSVSLDFAKKIWALFWEESTF